MKKRSKSQQIGMLAEAARKGTGHLLDAKLLIRRSCISNFSQRDGGKEPRRALNSRATGPSAPCRAPQEA